MPLVDHGHRHLHLKLVYYGPGLGGKTTNLRYIHGRSDPRRRGRLISMQTEAERTLFFDLLPVELGRFRGYQVRLHLCTVPGQAALAATRRLVLRGADAVVFVADSQRAALDANRESWLDLESSLRALGRTVDDMPLVIQFNKRDLPDVLPIETLKSVVRPSRMVPEVEASALEGWGVFRTLKLATTEALKATGDPAKAPQGRTPSILPGRRASLFPGGIPAAAHGAPSAIPPMPGVPRMDEDD